MHSDERTARKLLKELEATERETNSQQQGNALNRTSSKRMRIEQIHLLPEVFQPRGGRELNEQHVQGLARLLLRGGRKKQLTPVLVIQIGKDVFLVDGHHRLEAYRIARGGKKASLPVRFFKGAVREAALTSGGTNTKARLQMTQEQRTDYAWRLVTMGGYSKSEIARASSVGERTVARMRVAVKELGIEEAATFSSWWQAKNAAEKKPNGISQMSEEDRVQWMDQESDKWAEKLGKALGTKMPNNPELAAMALQKHLGRRLKDVLRYLEEDIHDLIQDIPEDEEMETDF